jgi:A/G-specific adenine glycosylase
MKETMQALFDPSGTLYSRDNLTDDAIARFRQQVLSWYKRHGRHEMAWRHTTDPYQILISEIMLQQTQVERVITKFPEFIGAFPDFPVLAAAPLPAILAVWQGMGYNRRAISLKKCAGQVMEDYGGCLPADPLKLTELPGIGPATAASICAFAFNMPVVFVETNIRRVYIHFFFRNRERVADTEILPLVERMLDRKNPRVWYWALMDLGAVLKRTVPNPNRRSSHYTRQAPFEGSDRQLRGRILRLLIRRRQMQKEAIVREMPADPGRSSRVIDALVSEGFLEYESDGLLVIKE